MDQLRDEEKQRSFAIFRHTFSEASKMIDGKWYDSSAFYVQGSAWKIGVKIVTEDHARYLGLYLRRYCMADDVDFRDKEYYAEVEMKLVSQNPDVGTFKREYQQKFDGGKKSNYGWPEFKPWNEVMLPKNGFIKNDSFVVEVYLAASPPTKIRDSKKNATGSKPSKRNSERKLSLQRLSTRHVLGDVSKETLITSYKRSSMCFSEVMNKSSLMLSTTSGTESEDGDADDELESNCVSGSILQERAQSILDTGLGSDCEFLVSKKDIKMRSFKASQLFLTRASPVFEKMFFGEKKDKTFIEVTDLHPDAFWIMLQFVYNCHWEFASAELAVEVYLVAHKYSIVELKEECVKFVWPTNVTNLWHALHLATHYHEPALRESTMKLITDYTQSVFAQPAFLQISHTSLISIVEQHHLNVESEMEVFMAAKKWAAGKCSDKRVSQDGKHLREELGNAIKYIRFLTLTSHEFIGFPMESGILSADESVVLLRCINNRDKFLPCPQLCSLRKPRNKKAT